MHWLAVVLCSLCRMHSLIENITKITLVWSSLCRGYAVEVTRPLLEPGIPCICVYVLFQIAQLSNKLHDYTSAFVLQFGIYVCWEHVKVTGVAEFIWGCFDTRLCLVGHWYMVWWLYIHLVQYLNRTVNSIMHKVISLNKESTECQKPFSLPFHLTRIFGNLSCCTLFNQIKWIRKEKGDVSFYVLASTTGIPTW